MPTSELPDRDLRRAMILRFGAAVPVLAAVFFIPAGTLAYWEAWVYMAVLLVPGFLAIQNLRKTAPELLVRRMQMREREVTQSRLVAASSLLFLLIFILPGLDHRFGWSSVPPLVVLAADAVVVLGFALVWRVFRENQYASRVVQVEGGQRVITTGPYASVRHPMYTGVALMILATPVALGSYWALLPALTIVPILMVRIRNEELVLDRDLIGYTEYRRRVKYRLVPGVW